MMRKQTTWMEMINDGVAFRHRFVLVDERISLRPCQFLSMLFKQLHAWMLMLNDGFVQES